MALRDTTLASLPSRLAAVLSPLLVEESPRTLAIDVRSGLTSTQKQAGTKRTLGSELVDALVALDGALESDGTVASLSLYAQGLGGPAIQRIAETEWFSRLVRADLTDNKPGKRGLQAVSRNGTALTDLNLGNCPIGAALGALDGMQSLQSLRLGFAGVDEKALADLASTELPALAFLDLQGLGQSLTLAQYARELKSHGAIGQELTSAEALQPLLTTFSAQLQTLVFTHCGLDSHGCRSVAGADWTALENLVLSDTHLGGGDEALLSGSFPALRLLERKGGFASKALATAQFLGQLHTLRLPEAESMKEAEAIEVVGKLADLEELDLKSLGAGPALARALVESGAPLRSLRLMHNKLGDDGVAALAGASFASRLTLLSLSGNEVGEAAVGALAAAPLSDGISLGLALHELDDEAVAPLWKAPWIGRAQHVVLNKNRISDQSIDSILAVPWKECRLNLSYNAFSRQGFQRLASHFGPLVSGARYQNPAKASMPGGPKIADSLGLKLVKHDGPMPSRSFKKLPKAVAAHGLKVAALEGVKGWFVGHAVAEEGAVAVAVTNRGRRIDPSPSIPVPTGFRGPAWAIAGKRAALAVPHAGVFFVDLDSGKSVRLGDCFETTGGLAWFGDALLAFHTNSLESSYLDLYVRNGNDWSRSARLDGEVLSHRVMVAHPEAGVAAIGSVQVGGKPVRFVMVEGNTLQWAGSIADSYRIGAGKDALLLEGGGQIWAITRE